MGTVTVEFSEELLADLEAYLERHPRYGDADDLARVAIAEATDAPRASAPEAPVPRDPEDR